MIGSLQTRLTAALAALIAASAPVRAQCPDCDGNGEVTVDEVVTMVNAALTGGIGGCPNADADASGSITVDEILNAVNLALVGTDCRPLDPLCGDGFTEGSEDCDDGGVCAGGESSGVPCSDEGDCAGVVGACVGGPNHLRGCSILHIGDCPDGACVKCRPQGGDGCAQNCTSETRVPFVFAAGSGMTSYGQFLTVPLPFTGGSQVLTVGRSRDAGPIPFVIQIDDFVIPRIPIQSIACVCVRGAAAMSCGGTLYDENGALAPNCTPGFEMQRTCPASRPCAPMHGVESTASGFIGCSAGSAEYGIEVSQDCNTQPNEPPFDPVVTVSVSGSGRGVAHFIHTIAFGTVIGTCTGTSSDYGPDGLFCTEDDDPNTFGAPNTVALTTGIATGGASDIWESDSYPQSMAGGARFQCLDSNIITSCGVNLAGVVTTCDQPTISDIVAPINFEAPPCDSR